ncbi:hypothetical protein AB0B25_31720 [Nocardia sp. NPDC049190]|uniref:hypothetical protein n=1 Tax=Nocardia sp. NPDC049190 TaxID=3155650 RepID=UPI0033F72239
METTISVPRTLPRPAPPRHIYRVLDAICSRRLRKDVPTDVLRDRVLFETAYQCGTRASEACGLHETYDPSGVGRILFAFFAAMAETDREAIRESTLEGLNAASHKGNHGGRPSVITDDMLHTVLRRRANCESVEDIRPDLYIPAG